MDADYADAFEAMPRSDAHAVVCAEGIGRLDISNEAVRKVSQEILACRGSEAVNFADYKAAINERAGRWDHACLWRKIEGTLLAMIVA